MAVTLADLQRACEGATKGPWIVVDHNRVVIRPDNESEYELVHPIFGTDAAFIALSRDAVPKLLAFVAAWDKYESANVDGLPLEVIAARAAVEAR